MLIAHFSDIHVRRNPRGRQLLGKRLVAQANLYIGGRARAFDDHPVTLLVEKLLSCKPDMVVCTGDLTAMSLPTEFQAARDLLAPVIQRFPFIVLPGNHDVYTRTASRRLAMEACFGKFMGSGPWPRLFRHGKLHFLALHVSRPTILSSTGLMDKGQLERLGEILDSPALRKTFNILLLHYPLRNRDGTPYRPMLRRLHNVGLLEGLMGRSKRIHMVLHGHEHQGFSTQLRVDGAVIPIFNPGSAGYAHSTEGGHTASFNLYHVDGMCLKSVAYYALLGGAFTRKHVVDCPVLSTETAG